MGTELESIAEALGESIPDRGKAFVGSEGIDEEIKAVLSRMAAQRGSELIFVPSAEETQALRRDFCTQCMRKTWLLRLRCATLAVYRAKLRCAACRALSQIQA